MPTALDLTGQKFGALTAVSKAPSRSGKTYWLCRCECGNEKEVQTGHLTSGAIQSCGCKQHLKKNSGKMQLILENELSQHWWKVFLINALTADCGMHLSYTTFITLTHLQKVLVSQILLLQEVNRLMQMKQKSV